MVTMQMVRNVQNLDYIECKAHHLWIVTIRCEIKREVEDDFTDFDLSHWKDEITFK